MIATNNDESTNTRNLVEILKEYRKLPGVNLFPTQKCVIGDPRSKAPLESAFYAKKYDDIALEGHVDEGSGGGCCLGHNYMVMDVDYPTPERPNKQGGESLERLQQDLGINLDDVPQVHSPTGGRHYYFKRPPSLKLRKMLKEYPGIEFITGRNYVLIAGSPHWQGGHYAFDADTELLGLHPTECPTELLDLLVKVPKPGEHKHIEPEDLEKLLAYLEPDDYPNYDDWLELAMASHSATGGAGLAEFTSWSAGGSKFSSECRVKEQWDSFDAAEEGGITLATLLFRVKESIADKSDAVQEEAMTDIARIRAVNEFDDLDFDDDPDAESGEKDLRPAFVRDLLSLPERLAKGIPPIDWLVRGILVANEPAIIGGPQKTLKTSIALALAIALATATAFLGAFPVPKRRKVLFLCGESGERTTLQNAQRMLDSAGLAPSDLENLTLGFDLPSLGSPADRSALRTLLRDRQIEVVIIDPAYLCLLAGSDREINAGSVFEMGLLLRKLNSVCRDAGTTLILLHHTKKAARHDRCLPTELDDLSQAGFREFARQWILLSRRTPYEFEGRHELRADVGGSAGHNVCYVFDIETGRFADPLAAVSKFDDEPLAPGESPKQNDTDSEGDGLTWRVSVTPFQEFVAGERRKKVAAKSAEEQERIDRVIDYLGANPDGETKAQIRLAAKIGSDKADQIIDQLLRDGLIVETDLKKGCGTKIGYRMASIPGESE